MIRMIQSSSAAHAKSYFSDALSKSDYYINDQELRGFFHGKLAERLGVTGAADKARFFALCENIDPVTGTPLTPRHKEDRTVGYDINFHCPKSVSTIHALSDDNHILQAFQKSVSDTMLDIQSDSLTRIRKDGRQADRHSGELLWAEFTHQTARPVDDNPPDPHLHSHCFVFNAAWDNEEQKIKAGQFRDINRDMPYYQARFHKRLSDNLIDLGYRVCLTGKSFEIEGVPQVVIDLFSKRTNEIGQIAKEKGITDAKELDKLGALTRSKKQKGMAMPELVAAWRKEIKENVHHKESELLHPIRFGKTEPDKMVAQDCVDYAIGHCFERASVMADRRFLEQAYRQSIGTKSIGLNDVTTAYDSDNRLIHVEERYRSYCTTTAVLAEEKHMVQMARKGRNKFRPLYASPPEIIATGKAKNAIEHVLTTTHQVSIVRGAAGSGKTTLMQEAARHIEAAGVPLMVVAPTAQAARDVLAKEGFENAQTVAHLLIDKELQAQLKNGVLWVDEAGLLGTKDMSALLKLAEKHNTRLILGGDTRQHSSVLRGDALRILNTIGNINAAEVDKIRRQKNEIYRAAVEDLSKGNVPNAFLKLESINAIKEVDPLKPNNDLVDDYVELVKKKKTALIVSPTHQQGRAVTDAVREKLRGAKLIGSKEISVKRLINLNFTEAQKTDLSYYSSGQIIQFNQNLAKIKRGSVWAVDMADKKQVTIKNDDGQRLVLPLDKANSFDVFNASKIGLSKGDKILITKGTFDKNKKRLDNGNLLEVKSVSKSGDIKLVNKISKAVYNLDKDFGHINHAYCSTSHSSQGKTVDVVLISQPAATFPATDAKQFYVSVSRGRDTVAIYTDDKEALLEHAKRAGDRQSAMELVTHKTKQLDYIQRHDRQKEMDGIEPINPEPNKYPDYEPRL